MEQQPIYGVFAFYRYYVLQDKYKAIVKFNLDHQAYFSKRDQIMETVNDGDLREYWKACILSFVCV